MPIELRGKYWTVHEVARKIGRAAQTVRNMIRDGRIPWVVKFDLNDNKMVYLIHDRSVRRLVQLIRGRRK